uniref:Uncharacterized protein n=1 Tax=Solanum lycopersicum TaxID=4081 RepID=A0A494G8H6_SOLLC
MSAVAGCLLSWVAYTGLDNDGLGMPSSTLESIHGRTITRRQTMLDVTCHLRPWTAHMVKDVGRGITLSPFDKIHDETTSGMACHHCSWTAHIVMTSGVGCHHRLWTKYIVARDRVFYAIIAIGKHTRSDDVGRDMPSLPLDSTHFGTTSACTDGRMPSTWHAIFDFGLHTGTEDGKRGMCSLPLCCIYSRMKSSVACHHGALTAHTVVLRNVLYGIIALAYHIGIITSAWHAIIALGMNTRLDDVRHGMPSMQLDNLHTVGLRQTLQHTWWMISCVLCHHRHWKHKRSDDVRRDMPFFNLGKHPRWEDFGMSIITIGKHMRSDDVGVTCHLCPCIAHTVGRLRLGMPFSQLDSIYGWRTSEDAWNHGPCLQNTVERCRVWKAFIALEQHRQGRISMACHHCNWTTYTRLDYIRHCRNSSPLGSIHWVARHRASHTIGQRQPWQCYNRPWVAHTIGRRRALNAIIALGQYTWSEYVGYCNAIVAFGQHTQSDYVGIGMTSWPLGSTHGWTTSSVAKPSSPFECTHSRMTLGFRCHHRPNKAYIIRRRQA